MGAITTEVVETGERRDVRGRRVVSGARRRELVEAFRTSGWTMAEFARREAINYTTFVGWIAKAGKAPTPSAIKFAEVKLPARRGPVEDAAPLEVRLADGTVVRGARVADVLVVVRALRA